MDHATDNKYEESQRRLLEEGTRSYLDAVNALFAYRKNVQMICRKVLAKHLDDYASALSVRLERDDIQDAEAPSHKSWEGDWWSLGVKIVRKEIVPGIRWWEAYCYLSYVPDDIGLHCWVGEWFPTKTLAARLFQKFHSANRKVRDCGNNTLALEQTMKFEDVNDLEKNLDGIMKEWIELWKNIGGIEQAFK
jgi:hypothetical protein